MVREQSRGRAIEVTITREEESFIITEMQRHERRLFEGVKMAESLRVMREAIEDRMGERGFIISTRTTRWNVVG
jgi:hypothetical protein